MFNKQGGQPPCTIFKIMKYINNYQETQLENIPTEAGESIEQVLRRLYATKQPIPDNVPPIYTPKEDGVIGDYDIRHDRFDTAYTASDKFAASQAAKSAEKGEQTQSADQETQEQPKNE